MNIQSWIIFAFSVSNIATFLILKWYQYKHKNNMKLLEQMATNVAVAEVKILELERQIDAFKTIHSEPRDFDSTVKRLRDGTF